MPNGYARDIDLNLLRVFAVVAEEGSVTRAAGKLYLTQPAVSAALTRLTADIGGKLFARQGRGLVLTTRGTRLFAATRAHLDPLVAAALEEPGFDPATSTATIRLGVFESTEAWLLGPLLELLRERAPAMQVIAVPVQFRTVEEVLTSGRIDVAVAAADALPSSITRTALFSTTFVCLFDPRFARIGKTLTEAAYFAHDHVVVSYAGDLRGIVEDVIGKQRSVRVSVASFGVVADLVEGSPLLGTVPEPMARSMMRTRPHLRALPFPLPLRGPSLDLMWLRALDEDLVSRFVRELIVTVVGDLLRKPRRP